MENIKDEELSAMLNDESLQLKLGNIVELGDECVTFKENIRPLKRGRNIAMLNYGLKAHADPRIKAQLIQTKRIMLDAVKEYQGEDPLHPWIKYIKWVEDSFPSGSECSGLVTIYEQCVRSFWKQPRYKEDLRYLKIWLEYARHVKDAEVIYKFLEANEIGQGHEKFYSSYALHMEKENMFREADDIFSLGFARAAVPLEKLIEVYRSFLNRTFMRKDPRDKEESHRNDENSMPRGHKNEMSKYAKSNYQLSRCKPVSMKWNSSKIYWNLERFQIYRAFERFLLSTAFLYQCFLHIAPLRALKFIVPLRCLQ